MSKIYLGGPPLPPTQPVFVPVFDLFLIFFEYLGLSCQVRPICVQVWPSWVPGGPSWAPSWGSEGDLGAKLGSKIDQKSIQNLIISWTCFLFDFGWILEASWVDFWWIFGPKLKAKLTKKSIIWPLVGKFAEVAKKLKNNLSFNVFWSLGLPTSTQN